MATNFVELLTTTAHGIINESRLTQIIRKGGGCHEGVKSAMLIGRAATTGDTRQVSDNEKNPLLIVSSKRAHQHHYLLHRKYQHHHHLQKASSKQQQQQQSSLRRKQLQQTTFCLNSTLSQSTPLVVSVSLALLLLMFLQVPQVESNNHLLDSTTRKISNENLSEQLLSPSVSTTTHESKKETQSDDTIHTYNNNNINSSNEKRKLTKVNARLGTEFTNINQDKAYRQQLQYNSQSHHNDILKKQSITVEHANDEDADNNEVFLSALNRSKLRRIKRSSNDQVSLSAGRHQSAINNLDSPAACSASLSAWIHFRSVYPALASHLFSLSSSRSLKGHIGAQVSSQQLDEAAQAASRLLDEAERLLRVERPTRPPPSWLLRAASNPAYARIIQHYLQQQQQQRQPQQVQQPAHPLNESPEDGQMAFGRLLHYPHQVEQLNGGSTSRTLDKLHLLSSGQMKQSRTSNTIDRLPLPDADEEQLEGSSKLNSASGDGDGESNWIESDSGVWSNRARNKLVSSSSNNNNNRNEDSLRNKFVYGNVLLKPPPVRIVNNEDEEEQQQQQQPFYHRQRPIETLRQLTAAVNSNNKELQDEQNSQSSQPSTTNNNYNYIPASKQQHIQVKPPGESYGRIIISPTSSSSFSSTTPSKERNLQEKPARQRADFLPTQWASKSTLDKLRLQLASSDLPQNDPNVSTSNKLPLNSLSAAAAAADGHLQMENSELVSQQEGNEQQQQLESDSQASHPEFVSGIKDNNNNNENENEFEGFWHPGPIQQVEVRQLHQDQTNGPHQLLISSKTTANPKDEFLVE